MNVQGRQLLGMLAIACLIAAPAAFSKHRDRPETGLSPIVKPLT